MADFISVSALNELARQVLAACEPLGQVIVCGEVSGFVRNAKSGHCYFTLKDETAAVKAVMFRDKARLLGFAPQDGMQVLAYGSATLYVPSGSFQVRVEFMRPFGAGAAQMAYDALYKKLEGEGLLDPARKRALPALPACIGVVTSKTGAALQDVCNIIGRRWPLAKLLLASVSVQGIGAEGGIVDAIRALDADPRPQLILVTRGGGSREDLWVFNSERIARAAAACRKPLVSAVGHEIDVTILDAVADLRAPTPSAAAELCVPDQAVYLAQLREMQKICKNHLQSRWEMWYNKMSELQALPAIREPMALLAARQERLEAVRGQLRSAAAARQKGGEQRLQNAAALAASLNPYGVLARGYAMASTPDGVPCAVEDLRPGQAVTLQGGRAWADCKVGAVGRGRKTGEGKP